MTEEKRKLDLTVPLYLTDRSAANTDDACGWKFWLNRKEGGRGIVPVKSQDALRIGSNLHEDMADIAVMDLGHAAINDFVQSRLNLIDDCDKEIRGRMEEHYRRIGWAVAWLLYIEPRLRAKYDNVAIESELILDRTPLWVAVTPDRLLRDKADKKLVYLEYKSTISAAQKWLLSWHFQIQLHTSLAAVNEEMGETVKFAHVAGMMKGSESPTDRRLLHPYVWGWYNAALGKWATKYEDARSSGWEPRPVWEYPGGIVAWVQMCGPDVANQMFPFTPPIFLDTRILDNWVKRRIHREAEIAQVEEECKTNLEKRAIYFPQRTTQCRPAFGDPCPYLRGCWNASTDLKKDPDFMARIPHHDVEIVGVD